MRRRRKDTPRESTTDLFLSWAFALTAAALPLVHAPVARDPNLMKMVALAAALLVIAVALVVKVRRGEALHLQANALDVCVILYLLITCASWTYSAYRYAAVAAIGPALACTMLYLAVRVCLSTEPQRRRLLKGLLVGCAAVSLVAILEQAGELPWGTAWEVGATWFQRTFLAAYLLLLLPVAAWATAVGRGALRLLGTVTLLVGLPALAFTGARVSAMAPIPMAVAALVGMWPLIDGRRRRQLGIAVAVLAAIGAVFVVATRHQIAAKWSREGERLDLMASALRVGLARPVLGRGVGAYGIYAPETIPRSYYQSQLGRTCIMAPVVLVNAHNEFLQVFAELGGAGLAAFLAIPVAAAWQARRQRLRKDVPGDVKTLGVALMTGIVGFLVANLVDPSARVPGQCAFYYLLLALIGSAYSSVVGTEDQREATEQRRTVTLGLLAVACGVLVAIVWAAVADVRSSTYVVRGETLLSNSSDVSGAEAAIGEFRRACALTPRNPVAQYELANALAVAGRHEEALRVYSIVEALSPNYGRIHFNQGASLYNLHRYSDAEREMAVAYRLDGLPDSRARLDYLRKMLHGPPTELAPVPRTSDPRR